MRNHIRDWTMLSLLACCCVPIACGEKGTPPDRTATKAAAQRRQAQEKQAVETAPSIDHQEPAHSVVKESQETIDKALRAWDTGNYTEAGHLLNRAGVQYRDNQAVSANVCKLWHRAIQLATVRMPGGTHFFIDSRFMDSIGDHAGYSENLEKRGEQAFVIEIVGNPTTSQGPAHRFVPVNAHANEKILHDWTATVTLRLREDSNGAVLAGHEVEGAAHPPSDEFYEISSSPLGQTMGVHHSFDVTDESIKKQAIDEAVMKFARDCKQVMVLNDATKGSIR